MTLIKKFIITFFIALAMLVNSLVFKTPIQWENILNKALSIFHKLEEPDLSLQKKEIE